MAYDNIIPDGFPTQYSDEWRLGLQQRASRLQAYVDHEPIAGEGKRYQKVKPTSSRKIITRFGDTNPDEAELEFRWLYVDFDDSASIVDRRDAILLGSIGSPHNAILKNQLASAGRSMDSALINGIIGTVQGGKKGEISYPFLASQIVAVNYVYTGTPANSGLTFDKLLEIGRRFGINDVTGQDVENQSEVTVCITHNQIPDMLHDLRFTSSDYSEIRRLYDGKVINLLGCAIKCVSPSILPHDDNTDIRTCVAYARSEVVFGTAESPQSWVDVLPSKKHNVQIRSEWGWGATRLSDEGVIKILCDESP
jgi:hypothetical protein